MAAFLGHQPPGLSWEPTNPGPLLRGRLPPPTFHSLYVPNPEARGPAWGGKRAEQSTKGRSSWEGWRLSLQSPSSPTPPKKQEGFKSDTKKDILTRPDAKQRLAFSKRSVGTCMEVVVSDFLNHLHEFSFICSFFQPYLPYYTPGLRPEKKWRQIRQSPLSQGV